MDLQRQVVEGHRHRRRVRAGLPHDRRQQAHPNRHEYPLAVHPEAR